MGSAAPSGSIRRALPEMMCQPIQKRVRSSLPPELAAELESAKKACGLPVAAGFGISTPEMARDISFHADAVVVGSAMVRTLLDEGADAAVSLIGSIAAGLRR